MWRNGFLRVHYYSLLISFAFLAILFILELFGITSFRKPVSKGLYFLRFLFDSVYSGSLLMAIYHTHKLVGLMNNVAI